MTYTVYIPDAERGPTSYTQRQFESIKALARWAMEAALEEPVAVPAKKQSVTDIATGVLQSPAVAEILSQFSGIAKEEVAERVRDPAVAELISEIEAAVSPFLKPGTAIGTPPWPTPGSATNGVDQAVAKKNTPSFLKPGAIIGLGKGDTVEELKKFMSPVEMKEKVQAVLDELSPSIWWQGQAAKEKTEAVSEKQQTPTIGWLAQDATKPASASSPAVELWEIDTDEWFTDVSASEWAEPLRNRNWTDVAKKYLEEIQQLFDHTVTDPRTRDEALSHEDQWWFKQLAQAYPQHFAENLFPEAQVRWELLPAAFKDACATQLKQKKYVKYGSHTTAAHRFAKDAFAILNFLRAGQRHVSWKDVAVPAEEGLVWGSTAAEKTAEKLLTLWWSGVKPTDAVREFILRAVVLRYFKQSVGTATTVGSAEFLTAYTECVRRMGAEGVLPAGFLDWATRGTSFKHCKAALTSLGIGSVRRADGQKYMNLEEIKDAESEVWAFESSLGDANCEMQSAPFDTWEDLATTSMWASSSLTAIPAS